MLNADSLRSNNMKKVRVIVFKIAKYWLALPMKVVLKLGISPATLRKVVGITD